MNGQTDICFIKFHEALLHCLGPIASFDSGYNVCTSLLLWVNVPNAYINTFWRSSASSSSREGRMCEKNPGTKNHH